MVQLYTRFIVLVILTIVPASLEAQSLQFRFIGNMAIEITDGETTLLSDFPYHSGAFGYMTYRFDDVKPAGRVICLITHQHRDHFNAELFNETDWRITGPEETTNRLKQTQVVALSDTTIFQGIRMIPITTPHANLEHYSYVVVWQGTRMYFSGDTEDIRHLSMLSNLDVAFISPWLYRSAQNAGLSINARNIVIYHHRKGERRSGWEEVIVPEQGRLIPLNLADK